MVTLCRCVFLPSMYDILIGALTDGHISDNFCLAITRYLLSNWVDCTVYKLSPENTTKWLAFSTRIESTGEPTDETSTDSFVVLIVVAIIAVIVFIAIALAIMTYETYVFECFASSVLSIVDTLFADRQLRCLWRPLTSIVFKRVVSQWLSSMSLKANWRQIDVSSALTLLKVQSPPGEF